MIKTKGISAVEFPGSARVHVGLASSDLERSEAFYTLLFGEEPTKKRPGYVKYEPHEPSVNLTLNQVGEGGPQKGGPTHFGIQVKTTDAVLEAVDRLKGAGQEVEVQESTTCCYAVQDKVWATDPDGNRWEVFVVLEADADSRKDTSEGCCPEESSEAEKAACC